MWTSRLLLRSRVKELEERTMVKRLILALCAALVLTFAAQPQHANACPLICHMVNGHWVCGCA